MAGLEPASIFHLNDRLFLFSALNKILQKTSCLLFHLTVSLIQVLLNLLLDSKIKNEDRICPDQHSGLKN